MTAINSRPPVRRADAAVTRRGQIGDNGRFTLIDESA